MKKIFFIIIFAGFLMVSGNVLAADNSTGLSGPDSSTGVPVTTSQNPSTKLQNPLRVDSISEVIILAVDIMIYVGVSFAILAIIFVGFKFIMAQGNSEKLKDAKMWFMWIIIGLAILISSKVIVEIVKNTLVKSGVVNQGFL